MSTCWKLACFFAQIHSPTDTDWTDRQTCAHTMETHKHKCTHTHTSKHFLSPSKQRREKRHTPPQRFSLVTGTPDAAWCCGQREGVPAEVPSDLPHSEIIHCLSVNFTIMQMLGSEAEAAQTANKCTTWNDHEQRAYVL